jgi:hypothetical protein
LEFFGVCPRCREQSLLLDNQNQATEKQ